MPEATEGYLLDGAAVQRIRTAVQRVEARDAPPTSAGNASRSRNEWRFGETVADPDGGDYPSASESPDTYWVKWVRREWDIDADADDGARAVTDTHVDGLTSPGDRDDGYGLVRLVGPYQYVPVGTVLGCLCHNRLWWGFTTLPNTVFAVTITQDGGSTDGDDALQCDRTYTAKVLGTTIELDTDLTPTNPRPVVGTMLTSSVVGIGYFTSSGAFVLVDALESLQTEACS